MNGESRRVGSQPGETTITGENEGELSRVLRQRGRRVLVVSWETGEIESEGFGGEDRVRGVWRRSSVGEMKGVSGNTLDKSSGEG